MSVVGSLTMSLLLRCPRRALILSPSMSEPVVLTLDRHIATLTLNVPDKRNAMSGEMTDAFPRRRRLN